MRQNNQVKLNLSTGATRFTAQRSSGAGRIVAALLRAAVRSPMHGYEADREAAMFVT